MSVINGIPKRHPTAGWCVELLTNAGVKSGDTVRLTTRSGKSWPVVLVREVRLLLWTTTKSRPAKKQPAKKQPPWIGKEAMVARMKTYPCGEVCELASGQLYETLVYDLLGLEVESRVKPALHLHHWRCEVGGWRAHMMLAQRSAQDRADADADILLSQDGDRS